MSDFKEFLDKVLEPIRGDAQDEAGTAMIVLPPDAKAAVAVSDDELQRRYVAVVNAVFADALERRSLVVFADVLTWKLAMIANHFGSQATGDILQKFGAHLEFLAAAEEAQGEADKAKKEGRLPN